MMTRVARGAHLVLQSRTRVFNGEWEATFREWYPGFRASSPQMATSPPGVKSSRGERVSFATRGLENVPSPARWSRYNGQHIDCRSLHRLWARPQPCTDDTALAHTRGGPVTATTQRRE